MVALGYKRVGITAMAAAWLCASNIKVICSGWVQTEGNKSSYCLSARDRSGRYHNFLNNKQPAYYNISV